MCDSKFEPRWPYLTWSQDIQKLVAELRYCKKKQDKRSDSFRQSVKDHMQRVVKLAVPDNLRNPRIHTIDIIEEQPYGC